MQNIFLSYSFKNENQPLMHVVRNIIECAGFRFVDGKVLENIDVSQEVQKKINASYGMVCLVSPEAKASGWVEAEVGTGHWRPKKLFVLRHYTVGYGNAFQGMANVEYSDQEPLTAVATLAGTIGMWKQGIGNPMRAVLLYRKHRA